MCIEIKKPYIKDNCLIDKDNRSEVIKVPKGVISSKKILKYYEFRYLKEDGIIKELIAKRIGTEEEIIILPKYSETCIINFQGRDIEINMRIVDEKNEYEIANSIIECVHYMGYARRGIVLVAELKYDKDKEFILSKSNDKYRDLKSLERALCNVSNIVGCVIIDELTYAKPSGREAIADEIGVKDIKNKNRREQLDILKVAWISRIAILGPYQNMRIATKLAEHAGKVANTRRIPPAKYIEVFITKKKEIAKDYKDREKQSFFDRAKYNMYSELLKSKPFYDEKDKKFIDNNKLYYYKKVGE